MEELNLNTTNEATQENKGNNRKVIFDWVVGGVAALALVIIYFFWKCNMDLWVTILGAVVIIAGTVLLQMQNKKINEKRAEAQ